MFYIFPVLPIIDLLKIRNRLANIRKVFSIICLKRINLSLKISLQRLRSFLLGKGSNIKGFKAKASSATKANGNILSDTIFIYCCRFWNIEQISINCHS